MHYPLQASEPLVKVATSSTNLAHGNFHPGGRPSYMVWGDAEKLAKKNPFVAEPRTKRKAPIIGAFTIGLNSGFGKKQKFKPEVVQKRIMKAFPDGGSAVLQLGWYKSEPEVSMRISIEKSDKQPETKFIEKFAALVGALAESLRQEEVWYEFYRGGKLFGTPMTLKHVT